MKKITILFSLVCFSFSFAQVAINEDFNSGTPSGWTDNYSNTATVACEGSSERVNIYSSIPSANLTSPNQVGASNGTDLSISFDYRILDYPTDWGSDPSDPTPTGWGSAELQYSTDDGASWTTALSINDDNHVVAFDCATMTTTVPAASLPNGSDVKLRIFNTWVAGDYYFYVDNFSATQVISNPPNCDASLAETTDVSIVGDISWSAATGAPDGYFLTVGTSSGSDDVLATTDVGNFTTYNLGILGFSSTYFVTIQPYNANGNATGCVEESFTTQADPAVSVDCSSGTPVNTTFCYGNNEDLQYSFVSTDGSPLRVSFVEGYFEDCCDDIIIYDGATTADTVLFQSDGSEDNDATGIEATSTGDRILVRLTSDGSVSCGSGSGSPDLNFNVSCVSTDTPDYYNLQFPATGTISVGDEFLVFAQVYAAGVTDTSATPAAGIEAWIGYSSTDSSPDTDADWTWVQASTNPGFDFTQNNDEYTLDLGAEISTSGTFYYASRWRLNGGPFVYGGILPDGTNGGEWGTGGNASGVLTVNAPANNDCAGAIELTPGAVFEDNSIAGSNLGATGSGETPSPSCSSYDPADTSGFGGDLWYSVVVPADGNLTIEIDNNGGPSTDSGMQVYSGTCGALVAVECNDDGGNGNFSQVVIEPADGLAGETLLIRVFEYSGDSEMNFLISAFSATLGLDSAEDQAAFTYYPNPVQNTLTLNAQNTIENVTMYNMLGQEVLRATPNAVNSELDTSSLQDGTYFVKVTIANTTKTIRVIKQ